MTDDQPQETLRARVFLAAACALAAALPFFVVDVPPITDLPQHVAQIRLFGEAMEPGSPYVVQWLTPYSLGYLPLAACWAVFPPLLAGRVALALLAVVTVLGVHALAVRRGRSPYAAVLATVLFFNHNLYWGFYSFVWGWPLFLVWLHLAARPAGARDGRTSLALAAVAVLLYFTHILWLAFALAYLALATVVFRRPWRRLLAAAPAVALAVLWYVGFRTTWFAVAKTPTWITKPHERLLPWELRDMTLGGIPGPTETAVAAILLAWVLAGLWQARARWRETLDLPLLAAAAAMFLAYVVLPTRMMNTVFFNSRWLPPGVTLLLLAVPAPVLRPVILRAGSLALVVVFSLSTAAAWRVFELEDLSGLDASLARLPARPNVIGLDFLRRSPNVLGRPFLQTAAWAQVVHGGRLNFSFAEFPPSPVVFAPGWRPTWTVGLEWYAERVRPADLVQFDHALVGALPQMHDKVAALPELEPLTDLGRWRLYRVVVTR